MVLLLYWLAAALAGRRIGRFRWVVAVAGGVGVAAGLFALQHVHPAIWLRLLLIQLMAAAAWWGLKDAASFGYLWVYLATDQLRMVATNGEETYAALGGLLATGLLAWLGRRRPATWTLAACMAGWTLQMAWQVRVIPEFAHLAAQPLPASFLLAGPRWDLDATTLLAAGLAVALLSRRRPASWVQPAMLLLLVVVLNDVAFAFNRTPTGETDQMYLLSKLRPGMVVPSSRLASLFPDTVCREHPRHLYLPGFSPLQQETKTLDAPSWLFFSNNPEIVNPRHFEAGDPVVLYRDDVPAGTGRIVVSHFNVTPTPRHLVVEYGNPDAARPLNLRFLRQAAVDQPGAIALGLDAGLELWRRYLSPALWHSVVVRPGASYRTTLHDLLGNGLVMADVEADAPQRITVAMASNPEATLDGPVAPLRATQSRGLYAHPDREVVGDFDVDARTCRVLRVADADLVGKDGSREDHLKGSYGSVVHIRTRLHQASEGAVRRALVLMVPSGGWVGALYEGKQRSLNAYDGLVVANLTVDREAMFQYDFTLPANSFGPVNFLFVPLPE